ncbi:MAG: hypothetical protein HQL25_01140 [Candidatus Omnitrophica bacterium]|nr:hypothetical protein [Candidatus Omnitrophota bacterium]
MKNMTRREFLKLLGLTLAAILIPLDKISKGLNFGKNKTSLMSARYYTQNDSLAG